MTGKLRLALVIALCLTIFCALGTNASAYMCVGNATTQVVKLYFNESEAVPLALHPEHAADAVICEAKFKNIPVQRTESSVSAEIRGHAALMLGPNIKILRNGQWRYTHEIANPMDIEMYGEEAWVHLLD